MRNRKLRILWCFVFVGILILQTGCNWLQSFKKYTVSGQITQADNNQGIAGVSLTFSSGFGTATTGADGKWSKSGLKGTVTITPIKQGWTFEPGQASISKASKTANFQGKKQIYPLTIQILGDGIVNQEVITTRNTYSYDTEVKLTANPAEGWNFSHWEEALTGSINPTNIVIDSAKTVKAVFVKKEYPLEVVVQGEGIVNEEIITVRGNNYEHGTTVKLTANPAEGWNFSHWEEALTGSINPTNIVIDSAKTVKAVFVKKEYPLEVVVQGEGIVNEEIITVRGNNYEHGTTVKLTANPAEGWNFSHWDGDLEGSGNPATIIVDRPKSVTAVFTSATYLSGEIGIKHNFPRSSIDMMPLMTKRSQRPDQIDFDSDVVFQIERDPEELIIVFDSSMTVQEQRVELEESGYEILDTIELLNAYLVKLSNNRKDLIFRATELKGVLYTEPNTSVFSASIPYPNDSWFPYQWHFRQIRLPQAWEITTGDRSIRIAVIDTGIDMTHPDLSVQLDHTYGYNFAENNYNVQDHHGHGTHVAGTIGALTNNSTGVAGVMWDVEILPVKVLSESGSGTHWDVALGILYGAGLLNEPNKPFNPYPADILNLSLGGGESQVEIDSVKQAYASGVIMVAAAGNESAPIIYPAALPEVIAVGAVDYNYPNTPMVTPYSNYGYELDVVAPGGVSGVDSDNDGNNDRVISTDVTYPYALRSGTSMATPHVSGVIGLMLSVGIPKGEVREILRRTSMEIQGKGFDPHYGYGLINAYWAVNAVDKIRIIVGVREGSIIDIAAETSIHPKGGNFSVPLEVPGEYRLIAWVDVNKNNVIDLGDYYAESVPFFIEANRRYDGWSGKVIEVDKSWPLSTGSIDIVP